MRLYSRARAFSFVSDGRSHRSCVTTSHVTMAVIDSSIAATSLTTLDCAPSIHTVGPINV
ncbi:hypothetical protein ACVDFE_23015 [Lentzea chajnantorensis]